jgi:hypothetical protein
MKIINRLTPPPPDNTRPLILEDLPILKDPSKGPLPINFVFSLAEIVKNLKKFGIP